MHVTDKGRYPRGTLWPAIYSLVSETVSAPIFLCPCMRRMSFGYFKGDKSASQWTCDFLQWLDRFTHYRDMETIFADFRKYFEISLMEDDYHRFSIEYAQTVLLSRILQLPFMRPMGGILFRRICGVVIFARKYDYSGETPLIGNRHDMVSTNAPLPAPMKAF